MNATTRRQFVSAAAASVALAGGSGVAAAGPPAPLVHHVLFWLNRPDSIEDRDALVKGIRGLAAIDTVRGLHVGLPADTMARGVVDGSWSVSEILYFDDAAGQDAYQVHPLHGRFVERHEHLWERVAVYDAIEAPPVPSPSSARS